jgi:hypothetical protein
MAYRRPDLTGTMKTMMAVAAFALAIGSAQAIQPTMKEGVDFHELQANDFNWSRGDLFKDLCDGVITFTNTGDQAIGNIRHRTSYVSETGVVHENSMVDAVIEKLFSLEKRGRFSSKSSWCLSIATPPG